MAVVNFATKNLAVKIVYYGPGLSGKTTNLRYIYFKLDPAYRGELVCLETDTERTYFFDLLPIKAGMIGEFKVHFQLMTVPGQVFYEASRKSVLKGTDGIIFVADSQIPLLDANLENFDGLRRNCLQHDIDLNKIPLVFQYNKRDLDYLIPVETFNNLLNPRKCPYIEAVAINGVGVFETLREISKLTVPAVREKIFGEKPREGKSHEDLTDREIENLKDVKPSPKDNVDFVPPGQADPIQVTKIKVKSQKDIEEELEKISRSYSEKAK
ncbi:MAG: GTP-binding protein [Candidatus Aminicenantales bacterium]